MALRNYNCLGDDKIGRFSNDAMKEQSVQKFYQLKERTVVPRDQEQVIRNLLDRVKRKTA